LRAQGISFERLWVSGDLLAQHSEDPLARKPVVSIGSLNEAVRWLEGRRLQNQVTWFVRELATLLRVGTPVMDALDISIQQCSKRMQDVLLNVQASVKSGISIAEALRQYPFVFDPLTIEMVTVGESSGNLAQVLSQLAGYREKKAKLKDRVLSALLYPVLVLCLSVGVSIFLMTAIVPTLIQSLQDMQKDLPLPTAILKTASDFLIDYGSILFGGIVCSILVAFVVNRTPWGALVRDRVCLRMPLLGSLIIKQNASRLCLVTATLLKSGVEFVRSLEIAESSQKNLILKQAIERARISIESGAEISSAIDATKVFPPGLVQVFQLGQNAGDLDDLLFQIAEDYESQVNSLADRLTTILEPLLIVGLSVVVGFIMLATILPILETGNALSETP
jgi:type II secretory pathway component PulF